MGVPIDLELNVTLLGFLLFILRGFLLFILRVLLLLFLGVLLLLEIREFRTSKISFE